MGNNLSREAEMSREIAASGEGGTTINISIFFYSIWSIARSRGMRQYTSNKSNLCVQLTTRPGARVA